MLELLRQLWFALNSANSTKSLSAAIVIGFIVGLTPTMEPHNLILLVIVLLFNVHVGLFLLGAALFSLAGFFLDPLFKLLGKGILTAEPLVPLWTWLYNLPYMRLSDFNNTILMGSLVTALVLALPLYFASQKLFLSYRQAVMARFSALPILGRFFYNETKRTKKGSVIRYSGLIVLSSLLVLSISATVLFFDPLVKAFLTEALEKSSGKKVKIETFKSGFFQGSAQITGFSMIDREESAQLFSFDRLNIDLNTPQLFQKRYIIEDLSIEGINFDKKLLAKIASAEGEVDAQTEEKQKAAPSAGGIKLPSVKEVLSREELRSVQRAREIEKELQTLQKEYGTLRQKLDPEGVEQLQQEVSAFQKRLKNMNDPAQVLAAKSEFEKLQKRIDAYQNSYKNLYTKLRTRFDSLSQKLEGLDKLAAQDLKRLEEKYTSAEGLFSVASLFTGGENKKYLQKAYALYTAIKPYMQSAPDPKDQTREKSYYRDRGEYILYEDRSRYPRIHIEQAKADATYDAMPFDAILTNYSTNQHKTGKPALLIATAQGERVQGVELKVMNNQLLQKPRADLNLKVDKYRFNDENERAIGMKQGAVDLQLEGSMLFQSDSVRISGYCNVEDANLYAANSPQLHRALQGIKSFDMRINGRIDGKKSELSISSDMSKKLSNLLAQSVSGQTAQFRQKLQAGIREKMDMKGLKKEKGQTQTLLQTLGAKQDSLQGLSSQLTRSFTKAQPSGGGEEVKGILKGLF